MKLEGRIWMLACDGKLLDDIDTDMIYHNSHLHVTDKKEMAKYAFDNLEGWEEFPKKVKVGDILIAGENFGSGSSRQHAVDCFISLGITAVIAKSFGAIYKRNAINSALAIFEWPDIDNANIHNGDILSFDTEKGTVTKAGKQVGKMSPMNQIQAAIYEAGGLFNYVHHQRS